MTEWEALSDPIQISLVNDNRTTQTPASFGTFALAEVAATGLIAQRLAAGRNFEALGHRFLRFDAFRTSHKLCFFPKERAV